jgi:hypothetical protein
MTRVGFWLIWPSRWPNGAQTISDIAVLVDPARGVSDAATHAV